MKNITLTLVFGNEFTLEYKFKPTADFTIEFEGNFNLHGSAGVQKAMVKIVD
jgi:hypothetical protein